MRTMVVLLALAVAGSASGGEKTRTALLNELIDLTHGVETGIEPLISILAIQEFEPTAEQTQALGEEIRGDADLRNRVRTATVEILAKQLSEKQMKQLVTFFKTDSGKAYCRALAVLAKERPVRIVNALTPPETVERSREKQTMSDLRNLAIASEAYATDTNEYPDAKDLEKLRSLLSPVYIRNVPMTDAWGTPFVYVVAPDKMGYRFVSAGPDKKLDTISLQFGMKPSGSDDMVFEDGDFVYLPSFP